MPIKWTGPLAAPPSWLDPAAEVTADPEPMLKSDFVRRCVDCLLRMGLSPTRAFEVVANCVVETGWGKARKGNNLGGWKIRKADALAIRMITGKPAGWYRAHGNLSSLDKQTVFYRAFESFEDFFHAWMLRFVPDPHRVLSSHRYFKTGQAFHGNGDWFLELCLAGYKGVLTQAAPGRSVRDLHVLSNTVQAIWVQHCLRIRPDGDWGPLSRVALRVWQSGHALTANGLMDPDTLHLMARLYALPDPASTPPRPTQGT